jgi:hypothetical protein
MIAWLKKMFGRGSKVDLLVRALPNPPRIRASALAWAETLKEFGDLVARWEPEDSVLLDATRQLADAADLFGPMIDGVRGADKLSALVSKLRVVAAGVGMADESFDAFWRTKGRLILETYIEKLRISGG